MTRALAFLLGTIMITGSIPVCADDSVPSATTADVRCIVVASVIGSDPAKASSAALLTLYFLGRIDGRESPNFDLSQAMIGQINQMSPADFSSEGSRCGKELEGRATYMAEAGKALLKHASDQQK